MEITMTSRTRHATSPTARAWFERPLTPVMPLLADVPAQDLGRTLSTFGRAATASHPDYAPTSTRTDVVRFRPGRPPV